MGEYRTSGHAIWNIKYHLIVDHEVSVPYCVGK